MRAGYLLHLILYWSLFFTIMFPQNYIMWTAVLPFHLNTITLIFILMRNKQKQKLIQFKNKWEYNGPKVGPQEWGWSRNLTVDKDLLCQWFVSLLWLSGYFGFGTVAMLTSFFSHSRLLSHLPQHTWKQETVKLKKYSNRPQIFPYNLIDS